MADKIDSNSTGLRYAEETSTIGTLPSSPTWYALEPNTYNDFGGQITTVAREPINDTRQIKKGVVTDLDASGGFNNDLATSNLIRLLQGFFYADIREKATTAGLNDSTPTAITAVSATDDKYTAASGLTIFKVGDLIFASGFTDADNNGLKRATAVTATDVTVNESLVVETSPPTAAKLDQVGFQFGSGEVTIDVTGSLPKLKRTSGTKALTDFGLVPGEFIFIGGDATATKFGNAADNGFARVKSVSSTEIVFDKTEKTMVADTGASKTIQIFFGNVIKNENTSSLIKRKTFQLERTLGEDSDGEMSEYLTGSVCNEFTLNVPTAQKVTADLAFISQGNEQRSGSDGKKSGSRPTLASPDAFNTTSDVSRIKLSKVNSADSNPDSFVAYVLEVKLIINNNASANKAIGTLGAFDVSAGNFQVTGDITAYFNDIDALKSVRDNADVTLDIALVKKNKGLLFDLPLLSLGDGRLKIEKDTPIELPLSLAAAESTFEHTLLMNQYLYLPDAAE